MIAVEFLLDEGMSGNLTGVFQWFGLLAPTREDQRSKTSRRVFTCSPACKRYRYTPLERLRP